MVNGGLSQTVGRNPIVFCAENAGLSSKRACLYKKTAPRRLCLGAVFEDLLAELEVLEKQLQYLSATFSVSMAGTEDFVNRATRLIKNARERPRRTLRRPFVRNHEWERFERGLSRPRLTPYLERAGHDPELALALYRWNIEISAAFLEVLAPVEIIVRNAIDRELRLWNRQRRQPDGSSYGPDWTINPATQLASLKRTLSEATRQARKSARSRPTYHPRKTTEVIHDDIVAQLSFGVWPRLLPPSQPSNKKKQILWDYALVRAFPYAAHNSVSGVLKQPAVELVYERLHRLAQLRNRAAHVENLLDSNPHARLHDATEIVRYIDPGLRSWVKDLSRAEDIARGRP